MEEMHISEMVQKASELQYIICNNNELSKKDAEVLIK